MSEATGEGEQIEFAAVAQLVELGGQRGIEGSEVDGDVGTPEQFMGKGAPAIEQLVGKLAADHRPVGDPLAGGRLGQVVERPNAARRKDEQVRIGATVHAERVAVQRPGGGDRGHRVVELTLPRQRQISHRRKRVDHRRRWYGMPVRRQVVTDVRWLSALRARSAGRAGPPR